MMYVMTYIRRCVMTETMTITKARAELMGIPKKLKRGKEPTTLAITQHGKPVLAVLPWELYEGLMETLEILGDEEAMRSLRKGLKDIQEGRTYSHEEVKERLGL
jgi:prevent-host-death family protein